MTRVIRHVTVRGRVQGVGYRAWVADTAAQLGLEGWVRNRRDGSVEAVFAGDEQTVPAMILRCRRGPPMAHVDDLVDEEGDTAELARRHAGELFAILGTV